MHPAYVMRMDFEFDRFAAAVERAGQVAAGTWAHQAEEGKYEIMDTVEKVEKFVAEAVTCGNILSFDSGKLAARDFRCSVSFSACCRFIFQLGVEGTGVTVPFDHADSPWTLSVPEPTVESVGHLALPERALQKPENIKTVVQQRNAAVWTKWETDNRNHLAFTLANRKKAWTAQRERAVRERPRIVAALRKIFTDPRIPVKTAQNEKFDRQHIRFSLGVEVFGLVLDTMCRHLTVDDRRGTHGLDRLATSMTGMGGYHKPLDDYIEGHLDCNPRKGGSYANIPGSILFPYGAADSDCTLRANNRLAELPEYRGNKQFQNLAEVFFPALAIALADMEYRGAVVDMALIRSMDEQLTRECDQVVEEIKKLPVVRQFMADQLRNNPKWKFKPGSDQQVGQILWEYYGLCHWN